MCALLALAGPPSEIAICTHTHTHTHTTRAGSSQIDIMEEASMCSPVDMYIGQLVMLTETVASMVATPMMLCT